MRSGPSPTEIRRARRLLIASLVLAWATHVLIVQWAHGAEAAPSVGFVEVVLKDEIRIKGTTARLSDVCRVVVADDQPLLDTAGRDVRLRVVAVAGENETIVKTSAIARLLADAGLHPSRLRFSGATDCRLTFDTAEASTPQASSDALLGWAGVETRSPAPTAPAAEPIPAAASLSEDAALTQALHDELAVRLNLPPEVISIRFRQGDEALLRQALEAGRHPQIDRADDLGRVTWTLQLDDRRHTLTADVTAEVPQLMATRPVGRGEVLRAGDLVEKTTSLTRLSDRTPTLAEAVGQEAARPLQVGEFVSADKLAPRLLVQRGQSVVVSLRRGGIEVRLLAKAMADGGYGQVVTARHADTGETLHVTVTGPQAGVISQPDLR